MHMKTIWFCTYIYILKVIIIGKIKLKCSIPSVMTCVSGKLSIPLIPPSLALTIPFILPSLALAITSWDADSVWWCWFTNILYPIVEIRQSQGHLISAMEFPILVRWHLYTGVATGFSGSHWYSTRQVIHYSFDDFSLLYMILIMVNGRNLRWSYDRLISTMGFPILVRRHLYIESGPRSFDPLVLQSVCFAWICST